MHVARTIALVFVSAMFLHATGAPVPHGADARDMDRSIKPGDDFYGFANGGWLKTVAIPDGQAGYDTRALLTERTSQRVRDLVREAASGAPVTDSAAQKVGAYYAAFMDTDAIEAKGLTPARRRHGGHFGDHQHDRVVRLPWLHVEQ